MRPEVGLRPVPGFQLTQPLGAGELGVVWEARNSEGQRVALRFLDYQRRPLADMAPQIRLLRALVEIRHPAILALLGMHAAPDHLILVQERADGSLADLHAAYHRQTGENIPAEHALNLLEQAARALDYLASSRLGATLAAPAMHHGAVRPSNLLLVGNRLKLGDLGLAGILGTTLMGKPRRAAYPYAAPETADNALSPASDQFALAVTFCSVVPGNRVFVRPDSTAGTGLSPIDPDQLRETERPILSRALHPDPSCRWPSCTAFIQALRAATQLPRPSTSVRIFPRGRLGSLRPAVRLSPPPVVPVLAD